ncbi:hypothetical protein [Sphingomonas sp.]|uniref:hypothetical protein n=1 Tax=Sphingomonas sp. TaxID=28214 RepID=UPI001DD725BD|nr:hypothetical protein [Sphingomonas sp.]MBX9797357.1 hypothetical protein [Sphingomonas sp.]
MFRQKTAIIVGAGASCELGLPSGDQLKRDIVRLLKPTDDNVYGFIDKTMIAYMHQMGYPNSFEFGERMKDVKEAADRIRKGLPLALSIDNFLHSHHGDSEVEKLGKLAIAISIIHAEERSYLFHRATALERANPNYKPSIQIYNEKLLESWYPLFAKLAMSEVHRQNISKVFDNLRFVIFNYDRCFEQYIWIALQSYFGVSGEEASDVLSGVSFIHPYGTLGPLPWQSKDESVAFGEFNVNQLSGMASRIRTFTESVQSDIGSSVKDAVEWADTIVILGFGYLDQNIQLLSPGSTACSNRVFSTALNVSGPDQLVMKEAMMKLAGVNENNAMIEPGSCRNRFNNYWLHLSLR